MLHIHRYAFCNDFKNVEAELVTNPEHINRFIELKNGDRVHQITPIFLAAIKGHVAIVKLLLSKGAAVQWLNETDHLIDWVDHCSNERRMKVYELVKDAMDRKNVDFKTPNIEEFKIIHSEISAVLSSLLATPEMPYDQFQFYELLGERGDISVIKDNLDSLQGKNVLIQVILIGAISNSRIDVLRMLHESGVNLSAPIEVGFWRTYCPAHIAAEKKRLAVLKYLHEIKIDLEAPIKEGDVIGLTPANLAAVEGDAEIIEWLGVIGVDLSAHIKNGLHLGESCVDLAANSKSIEVLKVLKKYRVNLTKAINIGEYQGFNILFGSAIKNHTQVLEYLRDEGLYKLYFPPRISMEMRNQALSTYHQIKPLSEREVAHLLLRKIKEDPAWFTVYTDQFFEYIEQIPVAIWVEEGSWDRVRKIYLAYMKLNGKRTTWLSEVCVQWINLKKPDFNVKKAFPYFKECNLEVLQGVVCAGTPLLDLLKFVSTSKDVLVRSNIGQLEQWINRILKVESNDEDFWQQALNLFQNIYELLKAVPKKPMPRNRQRKQVPVNNPFKNLWKKFEKKIEEISASPQVLQAIIAAKDQDLKNQFEDLSKRAAVVVDEYKRKWMVAPISEVENVLEREYSVRRMNKIQNFLDDLPEDVDLNSLKSDFLNHDFTAFSKMTLLKEGMNAVAIRISEEANQKMIFFRKRMINLESTLEADLEVLQKEKDFKLLQREMKQEQRFGSLFEPYANIGIRIKAREDAIWRDHQRAVDLAESTDELHRIRAALLEKKDELKQSFTAEIALWKPVKSARIQRMDEHKDRKIDELEEKLEKMTLENERLKQNVLRVPSLEKILPVVEAPLLNRLIRKLEKIAFISPPAEKALKMINQHGDILTKVRKIKKFLALFKIDYDRTAGSHSILTDGDGHISVADHDGDSKDYQIKAALQAVYDKLTKS